MVPFFIIYGFFVLTDIPLLVRTAFTNIQELLGPQQTNYVDENHENRTPDGNHESRPPSYRSDGSGAPLVNNWIE